MIRSTLSPIIIMIVGILLSSTCYVTSQTYGAETKTATKPNILWITAEDIGPEWGCYGDSYATTPHLDEYAKKSLVYKYCWSNAPVCAPARTTIITGVYPPSLGAQHMRSHANIPKWMRLFPNYLRDAGYYCTNNSKEDYNVPKHERTWDQSSGKAHYKNRKEGQPFFAVFNDTSTHESKIRKRPHTWVHDIKKAPIPAYHPDTKEVREDWAQYYDNITGFDKKFKKQIDELKANGLEEDTIVFVYGDHGSGMPRSKRWPYDSGLSVPLIVHIPEKFKHLMPQDYKAGAQTDRLVSFVDLAPTVLKLAGVKIPAHMHGHHFLGENTIPEQPYIYGFRGRMDERYDFVRSIRNKEFVYIENYNPHKIYGQYVGYMFQTPTTKVWKKMFDEGKLNKAQSIFWQKKKFQELYKLKTDPDEVNNLAGNKEYAKVVKELSSGLHKHLLKTRDLGFLTEDEFHRRADAAGLTPYEMGQKDSLYNLSAIKDLAATACKGLTDDESLQYLKTEMGNKDPAMRYWALIGVHTGAQQAYDKLEEKVITLTNDENASVSITACDLILKHTNRKQELQKAMNRLYEHVKSSDSRVFQIVYALYVLEECDRFTAEIAEALEGNPITSKQKILRSNEYSKRLLSKIRDDAKALKK